MLLNVLICVNKVIVMLNKTIEVIGWLIKSIWSIGTKIPQEVYEWIAVGLLLIGIVGWVF